RQAGELNALRAENERLLAHGSDGANRAAPAVVPADFIQKSALGDVGLGSPEAAIQTVFWAMCQGNLDRLSQCELHGSGGRNQDAEWERQNLRQRMSHFSGFRIAEKRTVPPDTVILSLQT